MALIDDIRKTLGRAQRPQAAAQAGAAQAVADVAEAATGRAGAGPAVAETPAVLQAQQATRDAQAQLGAQAAAASAGLTQQQEAATAAAALGQRRMDVQAEQAQTELAQQVQTAGAERGARQAQQTAQLAARSDAFARELAQRNAVQLNTLATQRGITVDQLFQDHQQGVQELAFRKDAVALEQKAHLAAMADREYIRNLTQIGSTKRLQDDLAWKAEVQRVTLGDKVAALLRAQGAERILGAREREFQEYMSSLDADTALAMIQQQARDQTISAGVSSAGAVAQGMAQNYKSSESPTPQTEDEIRAGTGPTQSTSTTYRTTTSGRSGGQE